MGDGERLLHCVTPASASSHSSELHFYSCWYWQKTKNDRIAEIRITALAEITSGATANVEFLKEEIVKVLPGVFLKDLGIHSAVTWVSPPSFVLPQIGSGCTRSAVLDFQLGENVFLAKLALPQEIFPRSVFWAHPGYGAFCKCLVSKAWRAQCLCWAVLR